MDGASAGPASSVAGLYESLEVLGEGGFGRVLKCRNRETGALVAVKQIEHVAVDRQRTMDEINNHRLLVHPHVIKFHDAFETPSHVNIVMEWADSGTLYSLVKARGPLSEKGSRWYFQQLIIAVEYCHLKGICMRDIKLENTLLQSVEGGRYVLKVCDFGYSKNDNRSLPKSQVGTFTYMAPEVISCGPQEQYCGKQADMWSCGVMLYTMLAGRYPFQVPAARARRPSATDFAEMLARMRAKDYVLPAGISANCRDLLSKLLEPDPTKRITVEQVQQHAWYLRDLPAGATNMNARLVARQAMATQKSGRAREVVASAGGQGSSMAAAAIIDGQVPL